MRNVIKLDDVATLKALDSALQCQAPVILESPEFNGATINGFLIAGDQQALLMQVTGRPAVDLAKVIQIRCEGQIYGDRRFCFNAKITGTPKWGESQALSFVRPTELIVMERRRFFRAKLAPSTKVALCWNQRGTEHRHHASLMNISADGISCRIDDAAAVNIEKNARISASFELPGLARIDLAAIVSNKMPGSEGCSLLGLQFVRNEQDADKIAKLRAALGMEQGVDTQPVLNA
jgi:hypothetical protein